MRFCYYLSAIGTSNLDIKLDILKHNLDYIYKQLNNKFDIIINCYNSVEQITAFVNSISYLDNIYIHNKKGVLTELWLTNPHHNNIDDYDYILFILDDIKIMDMDIQGMISIKNNHDVVLLSPRVINATHKHFMDKNSQKLAFANAIEVYCFLMTPNDFNIYMSINTIENKWIWGVDFLFGFFNIKSAIYYKHSVKHMLPSKSNHSEANRLMIQYLKSHGFNSLNDIRRKYPPIIKIINP